MEIILYPGDTLWNIDGTHVLDSNGIGLVVENEISLTIETQEIYDKIILYLSEERNRKTQNEVV